MKRVRFALGFLLFLGCILLGQRLLLAVFDKFGKLVILIGGVGFSVILAGLITYFVIRQIKQE